MRKSRAPQPLHATDEELRQRFVALRTPRDVATLLNARYSRLVYHVYRSDPASRYATFSVAKQSGGVRTIMAPVSALKLIQQKLNQVLQAVYKPRNSAHGFVRGRSIRTNAERHAGQAHILNIDLEDFFPTINFGRVRGLFMKWPYNLDGAVATVLAQICCFENQLPQGAPTSPIVANMICAKMDSQLRRFATEHRCRFTRYGDDLSFSTRRRFFPEALASERVTSEGLEVRVGRKLERIIRANGFLINHDKIRLQHRNQHQEVTGLTVNRRPNVPRRYVRQLRAMLHAWGKHGEEQAQAEFREKYDRKHRSPGGEPPTFRNVVKGKLEFLAMVKGRSDPVFINLLGLARDVDGEFWRHPILPDAVWVLECQEGGGQGSAFMLEEVGLVTCAHVVTNHTVAMRSHDPGKKYAVEVVKRDDTIDLAVLRIDAPRGAFELPMGNPKLVKTGHDVTLLGYPRWYDHQTVQIDRGVVTGFRPLHGVRRISISATIIKGNSGGPVLNRKREVIGVAALGFDTRPPDFENSVIPIDALTLLADVPGSGGLDFLGPGAAAALQSMSASG